MLDTKQLTHLKQLEAESIHIIREVVAEFDNPVMMYSVGKDSAVMLHLALKAFAPAKLPFPLLHVIKPVLPKDMLTANTRFLINPTGRFVIGGPAGDCGLTGRKIIVDTYGGACPHGGGAFSGKDPTKVDRSAAYAARYVAKNVVAAGLARQCQVQVAYAIGVARPMNITVYTEGTGVIPDEQIAKLVHEHFDLRPKGIIQMLDLLRPIYAKTAAYGHFGREEPEFTWERTDKAAALRAAAGL